LVQADRGNIFWRSNSAVALVQTTASDAGVERKQGVRAKKRADRVSHIKGQTGRVKIPRHP